MKIIGPWNHETEPHCCGCWVIQSDGEPFAKCNECGKTVRRLPLLSDRPLTVTRYNDKGDEVPDGVLVFYSDWEEMKQRASQAESARATARAAERERCARVCDEYARQDNPNAVTISMMAAKSIRALTDEDKHD